MATFLETLADTGIVGDACQAASMNRSGAYALRNRDPVFAAAWRAAQSRARSAVADALLERSITGTVEHYYRDGVLVGERRHYESWLGLAVLKRLDRQAEDDRTEGNLSARIAEGWQAALDALRDGGTTAVPPALEPEVDKVDKPPPPALELSGYCWKSGSPEDLKPDRDQIIPNGTWMTWFPPPRGFDGYENCTFDGLRYYERICTAEESRLLDDYHAEGIAADGAEMAAFAEEERDDFFARVRSDVAAFRATLAAMGSTSSGGTPAAS